MIDLVVLWYRTAGGVAWQPIVVDESEVGAERARLRKQYNGRGGVETCVKRYVEIEA